MTGNPNRIPPEASRSLGAEEHTGILRERAMARSTGQHFVVFLIGMRINRVLALGRWIRVARAMPPMLRELYAHRELGFLSGEVLLNWRGVTMLQYWRSAEALEAFANARDHTHFPAWQEFYRHVGRDGSVGIWHETYCVAPGGAETVYVNMPAWGLSRAIGRQTVTEAMTTARQRLAADRSTH